MSAVLWLGKNTDRIPVLIHVCVSQFVTFGQLHFEICLFNINTPCVQ